MNQEVYTEQQVRRWLAWLARGMQARGQSVFLIEDLQPIWLAEDIRAAHTVLSFLISLAVFLIPHGILLFSLWGRRHAISAELFAMRLTGNALLESIGLGAIAAFFLVGGFAFLLVFRRCAWPVDNCIRPAERLSWSTRAFIGPFRRQTWGWLPLLWPLYLPIVLVRGVFAGLQTSRVDMKTAPNQGIRMSLRNSALFLLPALVLTIRVAPATNYSALTLIAVLPWMYLAAWFGGLAVLDHWLLRYIIYRLDYAPLDYPRFLDYAATQLGFLQKVGGGYIFMHRYLLEYFATMEEAPDPVEGPVASPQS